MKKLFASRPVSVGVFLSYRCSGECRHCMYACSPRWKADWISEKDLEKVLSQLSGLIQSSPLGADNIGVNYGLHFTGGEPFLNFELLLKAVEMAREFGIPSVFVETNCFWCVNDEVTREKFLELRDLGLNGVLISVNPFVVEHVSFDRIDRAVRIGREIFGWNALVYQEVFYKQFKMLGIRGTLSFEEYLRRAGFSGLFFAELLPMGRACYKLENLFEKFPVKHFFGESCKGSLTRGWHVHIDNYCNYMPGYCGGISLGDARNLDSICGGIDLEEYPILSFLVKDLKELYEFAVKEFGYEEREEGYISKCHLCLDVRRHIVMQTDEFKELKPREFYLHLE